MSLSEPLTTSKLAASVPPTVYVMACPSASVALNVPTTAPAEFSTTVVADRPKPVGASLAPVMLITRFWLAVVLDPSLTRT
uniref:hypothetical protein n=1 Tax=Polynucleobacter sp. TaxID=2029855 RepID=UPI004048B3E2